jgi:hypothetical protein
VVLAADGDSIRIVFRSSNETNDLTRVGNYWVTERGDLVEIESMLPVNPQPAASFMEWVTKSLSACA